MTDRKEAEAEGFMVTPFVAALYERCYADMPGGRWCDLEAGHGGDFHDDGRYRLSSKRGGNDA